jgi:hypothetical protein
MIGLPIKKKAIILAEFHFSQKHKIAAKKLA